MSRRFPAARCLAACLLAACALAGRDLHAGEVLLANGDRITGEIVTLAGGALEVGTEYAGEIEIAWPHVVGVTSETPLTLVLADGTRLRGSVTTIDGELHVVPADRDGTMTVAMAEIVALNPSDVPAVRLKGNLAASVAASSGNTESDRGFLEGRFVARTERNRFTIGAAIEEGRENGRLTASRTTGGLGYDHFLGERWFWSATAALTEDDLQDLALRSAVALSAGYQVLEGERANLALETGLSYVHEDFETAADDSYPAGRWALDVDRALLGDRVVLFHRHELLVSLEDSDDLLALARTGARFALFAGLAASLQLNWDHDETPAPGREQDDTTWLLTLGYQW